MSFRDWVRETKERYDTMPPAAATRRTIEKFGYGVSRRTLDHWMQDSVWDEEWDVLVILDAARHDQMQAVVGEYDVLPDDIDARWSEGSWSVDWIRRVFDDDNRGHAQDTGYVSANPFSGSNNEREESIEFVEGENIGYFDDVWKDAWAEDTNGIQTVAPSTMTDRAIWAWRNRDELDIDRLIVHYMQPHQPFRQSLDWQGDDSNIDSLSEREQQAELQVWQEVKEGHYDAKAVWDAYQDNLRWALDDVTERLVSNCEAHIAISSDHGNGIGEWGVWGHPPGVVTPELRRVPWLTVTGHDDQTYHPPAPPESDGDNDDVSSRLEALGYI